jgi:hypothetical protein
MFSFNDALSNRVGRVINELGMLWEELDVAYYKWAYFPGFCLEVLGKIME